ncbi:suppressor of fused domain protein [Adhaeribacter radiodurans]|uniref:Suppressor of fused domain protein n=1 Tax=Adhaeribacter radiodurans TaxID=2745197 RepID=A0A7L7LCM9_9BACT|nr:suppressor of fused domain protein [Adhaeribacter radiodurans]QMU30602.1 suppressor of fused domain protein [Adhaeribacter radiodurans]
MSSQEYVYKVQQHYESYFQTSGNKKVLDKGPKEKLHPNFYILEFAPNKIHDFWTYCTVGMSVDCEEENLIELFIYSPRQDVALIELLTVAASYHRNVLPLDLNHTVNIGQPWLDDSKCDHGFISLPYLDGEQLEILELGEKVINCYWFIPITEKERDYKMGNGVEDLEQLFEEKQLDYLNPNRKELVV